MKLRRAFTAAAATAAILPATLLAAPAAFAEEPSGTPTPTSTQSESGTPTPSGTPTASDSPTTPAPSGTPSTTPPPTNSPSPSVTTTTPGSSPSPSDTASPTGTPTGTPTDGPSASPSASESEPPAPCEDSDHYAEDPDLSTTLVGLPTKVVAGSGYHGFTFTVKNDTNRAFQRVDLGILAGTAHANAPEGTGKYLTLQFKNPDTGFWENISTDADNESHGYVGYTSVRAHEKLNLDLRLSVAKKAPDGFGYAISIGVYADEEGNCVFSSGDYYEFEVVKSAAQLPGGKESEVPDAKPQGGKKPLPLPLRPAGNKAIHPQGELATTGSDSNLPTIAMIGGVAMVAGAGAIFVVRRRRAEAAA
ncbi:LAETG motif-containing sortase-dependent surface protein [Streptomyces zagrosensis]|uniref:LPXTG-motif cell wall-anchored protein n=1 Tax=Streptomyces zagrosensis TaxID=1042984 RepID=A0A7W9Q7D7_9ACTN|nr:LAETG motif-containing sortase-dependent surface protein [Streptomyces zagrosensis]MBB5934734.1 LPXTG-motif cell wall-anchored protein [Streptomyces zagrosensis]